jgi:hypothetical protein
LHADHVGARSKLSGVRHGLGELGTTPRRTSFSTVEP